MPILITTLFILALITDGWPIEILMDGQATSNIRFCVGDNVTFICTIQDGVHQWVIDSPFLSNTNGFFRLNSTRSEQRGPFTIIVEDNPQFGRVSSINVIIYENFGDSIGCLGIETMTQQSVFIDALDPPSAPNIFAESNELYETLNLTIKPPDVGKFCVTQYNIKLTDNINNIYNGSILVDDPQTAITVDIRSVIGEVTLDICKLRYKFQVAASNGKETPPTAPVIDFSRIGDLSSVIASDFEVEWSVPNNLQRCIVNYFYTLDLTNQSNFLNSTRNRMLLSDFGPPRGDCSVDDVTIIPVISAMDEPLYNNSATDRVFLRMPFSVPPMVVQTTPFSITVIFRVAINDCPNGMIEVSIVDVNRTAPLRFQRVPLNVTEITFVSLNESINDYFCSFAIFTPILGVFHTEKIMCVKNSTSIEASIVEVLNKNRGQAIGIGLGTALAVILVVAIAAVVLAFIMTQLKVLNKEMNVRRQTKNKRNTIGSTLATLRDGVHSDRQ